MTAPEAAVDTAGEWPRPPDGEDLAEIVARYETLPNLDRQQFDGYLEAESTLENQLLDEAGRLAANCEHTEANELLEVVIEMNATLRDVAERERARSESASDPDGAAYLAHWRDMAIGLILLLSGQKELNLAEQRRLNGDIDGAMADLTEAVEYFRQLARTEYPNAWVGLLRGRLAMASAQLYEALGQSRVGNFRGAHDLLDEVRVTYEELLADAHESVADADEMFRSMVSGITRELTTTLVDISALQAVVDMMLAGLAGRFADMVAEGTTALRAYEASVKAAAAAGTSRNLVALRRMEQENVSCWVKLATAEIAIDEGDWERADAAIREARQHWQQTARLGVRNTQVGVMAQRPDSSSLEFLLQGAQRRAERERRLRERIDELQNSMHRAQLSSINVINNAHAQADARGGKTMGDTNHFHAPVAVNGAIGSGAQVSVGNARQHQQQLAPSAELRRLADELAALNEVLSAGPRTERQRESIERVRRAEAAARSGDEAGVRGHLSDAGRWVLGIAERIGVEVATAALRQSIGA